MPLRLLHILVALCPFWVTLLAGDAAFAHGVDAGASEVAGVERGDEHLGKSGAACADASHDHCDCGCDDCEGPGCFDCGCDHGVAAAGLPVELGAAGQSPAPDRVAAIEPRRPWSLKPAPPLQPPRQTFSV
jgi:hypothetical protein